jgi:hypothetical protein
MEKKLRETFCSKTLRNFVVKVTTLPQRKTVQLTVLKRCERCVYIVKCLFTTK